MNVQAKKNIRFKERMHSMVETLNDNSSLGTLESLYWTVYLAYF